MKDSLSLIEQRILLFSVFVLSLCGITYELVLGSLATYLMGNPVQQYSITIGFFLSSMGAGSYLSRFIVKDILKSFIVIEIVLGLVGGLSILILHFVFSFSASYYLLHVFFLIVIGTLVGLEIPLLTRILRRYGALKDIISNVLTLDYMGGLAGSLLFPLLLFPFVGRMLASIIIGVINIAVAFYILRRIDFPGKRRTDYILPIVSILTLLILAFNSENVTNILQKRLYYDDIVFSKRSKYQEIVLTRNSDDFRLYLDGSLQFSTFDEYRYHEMLVFPVLSLNENKNKNIIILGGGDGIAVREALTCEDVDTITLVELDPAIISLAMNNPSFKMINSNSLHNERVKVIIGDAYNYLRKSRKKYDVIIADFPDPHDETISKLYTYEFFRLIYRSLKHDGFFVTQSTSPLFATEAFWCINTTLRKVFPNVIPYHIYIPSFGDWGFNIAAKEEVSVQDINVTTEDRSFFSKETFLNALHFPEDTKASPVDINTFNKPVLYRYYIKGWKYMDY